VGPIVTAKAGAIEIARPTADRKMDRMTLRIWCVPPLKGWRECGLS
jgi:hypothetical protein